MAIIPAPNPNRGPGPGALASLGLAFLLVACAAPAPKPRPAMQELEVGATEYALKARPTIRAGMTAITLTKERNRIWPCCSG